MIEVSLKDLQTQGTAEVRRKMWRYYEYLQTYLTKEEEAGMRDDEGFA